MIAMDRATVGSLSWLVPMLLARRFRRPAERACCYYFEASPWGAVALTLLTHLGLVSGCQLEYAFTELRDQDGTCLGQRITSMDLAAVCQAVRSDVYESSPLVRAMGRHFNIRRVLIYLEKWLAEELAPIMTRVAVVSWYQRTRKAEGGSECVLYLARTPWHPQLQRWAEGQQVLLRQYGVIWSLPGKPADFFMRVLKAAGRRFALKKASGAKPGELGATAPAAQPAAHAATVAVSYQGKGVGFDLSRNSDLFWVPFAQLAPSQILVYFTGADDPLDPEKFAALTKAGIRAIAMSPSVRTAPEAPLWQSSTGLQRWVREARETVQLLARACAAPWAGGANCWIALKLVEFTLRYNDWEEFFEHFNVVLHVDYSDWTKERLCADEAVSQRGGIALSYQLADESSPAVARARAVDVHLGFSPQSVDIERQSHSSLTQFVVVGYVRDYAFARVQERARRLRQQVAARGAQFVITYLDENSSADKRRAPSHEERAEDYRFLLERLLAEPTLGLLFKPKKPLTLRHRLGAVAALLEEALATGRCVLVEGGAVATPMLPCEASQAADVTIGLLFGTSAALESALAGCPTLLVDREGLFFSPFYALGEGRVVFRSWQHLWQVLSAYRAQASSVPGFGDWRPVLDRLDPFRDGQAAERIGQYIGWLAGGLAEGLSPEQTMARARGRYAALWGADKVIEMRSGEQEPKSMLLEEPAVHEMAHAG